MNQGFYGFPRRLVKATDLQAALDEKEDIASGITLSGTDTYTGNSDPAITSYVDGQKFLVKPTNTNTGASTLALNGLAAKAIVFQSTGGALIAGQFRANQWYWVAYESGGDHFHAMIISDAGLSVTDVTNNNASTARHGFLKKLDNDATHFMDGQGNWSTPAGGLTFQQAYAISSLRL